MNIKPTLIFLIVCSITLSAKGQYKIIPEKGYSMQIGILVDMLEDIRNRIFEDVRDLNQNETDFLFDEKANSVGQIIMHLAATEKYYQVETLEDRTFTADEKSFWGMATDLGDESRNQFTGKPIGYYLDLWREVRKSTLSGLKTKDDKWLSENIDETINNHWAWFHILEHEASHMGQIALIINRMKKN